MGGRRVWAMVKMPSLDILGTENSADRKLAGFFDGYALLNKAQDLLLKAA